MVTYDVERHVEALRERLDRAWFDNRQGRGGGCVGNLGPCPVCPFDVYLGAPLDHTYPTHVIFEGDRVPVHVGCEPDAKHALVAEAEAQRRQIEGPTLAEILDADVEPVFPYPASLQDRDRDVRFVQAEPTRRSSR